MGYFRRFLNKLWIKLATIDPSASRGALGGFTFSGGLSSMNSSLLSQDQNAFIALT